MKSSRRRDLYPARRSIWLSREAYYERIEPTFDDYRGTWRKCFVEWHDPDPDTVDPDWEPPEGYAVNVEPWPRGVAEIPRDAVLVFAYITNEEIEEALWFRRGRGDDRAWVEGDGKDRLWVDSGGQCWLAAEASPPYGTFNGGCVRLIEAFWRARESEVMPERFTREGVLDAWAFEANVRGLEEELQRDGALAETRPAISART